MQTKVCGFAGEERPLDQFDRRRGGWQSYCRYCSKIYQETLKTLRETDPSAGAAEVRAALGVDAPDGAAGTRGPMGERRAGAWAGPEPHEDRADAVPCLSTLGDAALALLVGRRVQGLQDGLEAYRIIMRLPVHVAEEYRIEAADRLGLRRRGKDDA